MGIRFDCIHCGHTLHVKDFLAGKRAVCPHCQGKVEIPLVSDSTRGDGAAEVELHRAEAERRQNGVQEPALTGTAAGLSAAAESTVLGKPTSQTEVPQVIAEARHLQWYVLPPGSITKYGPAVGDVMHGWLQEGRVPPDAMVWREGWPEWRAAGNVFPQLARAAAAASTHQSAQARPATERPAVAQPAAIAQRADPVAHTIEGAGTTSVVLNLDEPEPATARRTPPAANATNRARRQYAVLVGTLIVVLLLLVPLLGYLIMR